MSRTIKIGSNDQARRSKEKSTFLFLSSSRFTHVAAATNTCKNIKRDTQTTKETDRKKALQKEKTIIPSFLSHDRFYRALFTGINDTIIPFFLSDNIEKQAPGISEGLFFYKIHLLVRGSKNPLITFTIHVDFLFRRSVAIK